MTSSKIKSTATAPLFAPESGTTVIHPTQHLPGYWAGAPSVLADEAQNNLYLFYRLRQPRGLGDDERGFEARIAVSRDGERFTDIWKVHKKELNSSSIERASLVKVHDRLYRLYLCYVDPADNRWRIDLLEAEAPHLFRTEERKPVLTADVSAEFEGVKDPYVRYGNGLYYMYFVYARAIEGAKSEEYHSTGDIHNTGHAVAPTGLAVSADGIRFDYVGTALPVGLAGWDSYQSRITAIVPFEDGYTVFWDGSSGVEQNYEEKVSLAYTTDLHTFAKLADGPVLTAAGGRAVRYVDAIVRGGQVWYYYEYTREDGSHELRLSRTPLPA